ncbi:AEC family transporter [Eubacteriales bacterium OttesenSCG-928-N13]|nr:AEC family transporter [Eubacteriales bacterium OttesenSCG-928-N13]
MQEVLRAVYVVLTIFVMIGLGMLLSHIGWIKREHTALLSKLVTRVALPAMIIHKLFTQYTRESLIESAPGILAPFVSLLLTLGVAILISRIARIPKGRRGVFCCMFMFSNSVFIGLPVSVALFGEGVAPYTLLYYIANTVLFWSVGHAMMAADGGSKFSLKQPGALKKLLPLPLITFIGCCLLVLLGLRMPTFILDAAGYVGDLVTPLSMIYTGILLLDMFKSGRFRWHKGYALILGGRFLVAPLLLLLTSLFIPMPALMRNALLIQAAMPVMSQTPIVAGECGSDAEYAAGGIALTTLCSLIFIPAYMALIQYCL